MEAAVEIAAREIGAGAPLIPIYSHRYIPSAPSEAGNPILSVYQTDVIYYGSDLEDYFVNEFFDKENRFNRSGGRVVKPRRNVPFWGELYELNS